MIGHITVRRFDHADQIHRLDLRALMQRLEEAMLRVGTRTAPPHRHGVAGDIPPTYRALALATARRAGSRGALTPIQIDAVLGVLEPPGVAGPSDTTEPPAPGEPR